MKAGTRTLWTFAVTSIALFMVVLDNLVVSTALPVIRVDLGASIEELEWTVNAYTLTFAVFLLTGAGARRPLRPQAHVHHRRRHLHARPRRGRARAVGRLADRRARAAGHRRRDRHAAHADDPQRRRRREARARARRLVRHRRPRGRDGAARRRGRRRRDLLAVDLLAERPRRASSCSRSRRCFARARAGQGARPPGLALPAAACSGSSGASSTATATAGRARRSSVHSPSALRSSRHSSPGSCARRSRCSRCGSSATARSRPRTARRCSCTSGCSARSSCSASSSRPRRATRRSSRAARILPWTLMPMFVAPIAGALSDRIGGRPLDGDGARAAGGRAGVDRRRSRPRRSSYASLVGPFILSGIGMALFFAPVANVVLSAVRPSRRARRPARTTRSARSAASRRRRDRVDLRALRRLRVAGDVHRRHRPALWVGACRSSAGSLVSLLIPRKRRSDAEASTEHDGDLVPQLEAA